MKMNNGVQIDTISAQGGGMVGSGSVAQLLMNNNFDLSALRTNTVLRKDEWLAMDTALIEIARKRLVAVGELVSRGLTFNIPNGLGTTILEWERVSDMEPAEVSMSGITEGERDTFQFDLASMPLPIIHKDFNINIRKLEASRKVGQPLDVAQAQMASTLVSEATEEMVFIGNATREGTARIYGLTDQPDRNTGSVTANWDTPATTGAQKLTDVLAMIASAQGDNMYGPYGFFVPQVAHLNLQDDFKANGDKTEMSRLMEIDGVSFIKASKDVPAGAVLMVQLTSDVIDEVIGMQPTVVQWESNGGFTQNFKVMSIMIPRIRSTQSGQSGVVHYS
jgi:uncharacterized linocin/CFP29 family protein